MRGSKITPRQVEAIKAAYAETGSIAATARAAGVPESTARKYAIGEDEFEEARVEKRLDIIEAIAHARTLYAEHLARPDVVLATQAKDAATVLGILTDKHQLLTGAATERREQVNVDSAREELRARIGEMARKRGLKAV